MNICFYRISPNSTNKRRITDKRTCLMSFLSELAYVFDKIIIVGDNCDEATIDWVKQVVNLRDELPEIEYKWHENMGNSGSSALVFTLARASHADYIYFAEDDYLYGSQAEAAFNEAVKAGVPAFTLYDHPDKYGPMYQYGERVLVRNYGFLPWKNTCSTTMTFGVKRSFLDKHFNVFLSSCIGTPIPHDHRMWLKIQELAPESLWSVLVPAATHTERKWLSPGRDWDRWARIMAGELE